MGRFLTVTREPHDDRMIERVYVRNGVSVILWLPDKRIRCIREEDVVHRRVRTKLVSGWLEESEDPVERAQQELEEELGLRADEWLLYGTASMEGAVLKKQYFVVASGLNNVEAHPEKGEHIVETVDFTLSELRRHVLAGSFGSTETAFMLLRLTLEA